MSSAKLEEALNDNLISFDCRVLITDLLQEYKLPYKIVEESLKEHLKRQEEKGTKYDKRYLVHGEEKETSKELYTVVQGEKKLQEWLQKLKNVEASLYSVEVDGGSKTPAQIFKPIQECALKLDSLATRANMIKTKTQSSANDSASGCANSHSINVTKAVKTENIKSKTESDPITSTSAKIATVNIKKETPEKKKTSPTNKKATQKAANKKTGGISNFFAPAEKKDTSIAKPATTKKMQDFFKKASPETNNKQTESKNKSDIKAEPNKSLQLFEEEESEHEAIEIESSDEEKLETLKRDIISSDHEEEIGPSTSNVKRRRVLSSDDEEEEKPQAKHEKTEQIKKETNSEMFIDEDGFVVTVKSKNSNIVCKAEPKEEKPKTKSALKMPEKPLTAKPKQGNIMNFFKKN